MKAPLLAVFMACAPALRAAPGPAVPLASVNADWRRDGVNEREQAALKSQGWRLEPDGRAISPKTKAPVPRAELLKVLSDLRNGARRAALERVNLMLSEGKPLGQEELEIVDALAPDLPAGLVTALKDPKSTPASLRALADADLSKVAAYFDGSRTLGDRMAAAAPVRAVEGGRRADLPYLSLDEQRLGDALRDASVRAIGADPFGKTVLSRLNGSDGKPDLPPILIGDLGRAVAVYDPRRQSVVIDREILLTSVVEDAPPPQRAALRSKLGTNAALVAHLLANPSAVEAFARKNDVVMVHEFTHAWQDRRETVLREIARGNLPDAQILEYEEEAYITKNLYIHSKLKHDPASVREDEEFRDYVMMAHGIDAWREQLADGLGKATPAHALNLDSISRVQSARAAAARNRKVATLADQRDKALDLAALGRGNAALTASGQDQRARLKALHESGRKTSVERLDRLAIYYLGLAVNAPNRIERAVKLDAAERYARASGDKALIEAVRKEKSRQ